MSRSIYDVVRVVDSVVVKSDHKADVVFNSTGAARCQKGKEIKTYRKKSSKYQHAPVLSSLPVTTSTAHRLMFKQHLTSFTPLLYPCITVSSF